MGSSDRRKVNDKKNIWDRRSLKKIKKWDRRNLKREMGSQKIAKKSNDDHRDRRKEVMMIIGIAEKNYSKKVERIIGIAEKSYRCGYKHII